MLFALNWGAKTPRLHRPWHRGGRGVDKETESRNRTERTSSIFGFSWVNTEQAGDANQTAVVSAVDYSWLVVKILNRVLEFSFCQGYQHTVKDPAMMYRVETMPGLGW